MAILLAILVVFAFFAYHNQAPVTLHLGRGQVTELPLAEVVLVAMGVGALAVLLIFFLREVRRALSRFSESRARKRRARAEELYQRGTDAHISGRLELAVDYLSEARRRDPSFLPPFYRLATIHREQGRPGEALAIHLAARASDPRNLRTLMNLSKDYLAMERFPEAIAVLREVIARDDGNRTALRRLLEVQERAEDWEGAIATSRRLLKASGRDPAERARLHGLVYRHAVSFMDKGKYGNAARFLRVVVKEDPRFVPALLALGAAEFARGRVKEGADVLKGGYVATRNPVLLVELEDQLIRLANPEELLAIHRKLADLFPRDVILTLFYGKSCLRLEMVDEALLALRKVESSGYDSPLLRSLLAEADYRRDRFEQACEEFRRALGMARVASPRYRCSACRHESEGWQPRCPECLAWNTLGIPSAPDASLFPSAPRYEGGH
jgi:lipopolysaccharide biosynthesis regulator YciM